MIKQKVLLLFIFKISLTVAFAQEGPNAYDENGKRHGLWAKNYKGTNELRYSGVFNHGKEVDTFKFYTLSQGKSVLSAIRVFKTNSPVAQVSFYTSTGGLISEGKMNGKIYIGKWIYYHKNSKTIMITEHYNDMGELHGPKKVFYKNGQLAEDSTYQNGFLQGQVSWYSEQGMLFKSLTYEKDQLEGAGAYYDANGNITSKGQYKNNAKSGDWLYYKDDKLYKTINHTTNTVTKME